MALPAIPKTTNRVPWLLHPVIHFRVSFAALALLAVAGTIVCAVDGSPSDRFSLGATFLTFTWAHNITHYVLAVVGLLFGFATLPGQTVRVFAAIFGVVYLGLGVAGLFALQAPEDHVLALTPTLNGLHLALGGWAILSAAKARF